MKKLLFLRIFLLAFIVASPSICVAAFVQYDVAGSINDKYSNMLSISGRMDIENLNADDVIFDIPYLYQPELSFDFNVGEYAFYGAGHLDLHLERSSATGEVSGYFDGLWLYGDAGAKWAQWLIWGMSTDSYVPLGDVINFHTLFGWWYNEYDFSDLDCPVLGNPSTDFAALSLTLTRQDSIPVPESATGILFGIGITGILIFKRRHIAV